MRLKEEYQINIIPSLKEKLNLKNNLAVPKITKIVLNVGINKNNKELNYLESVKKTLAAISGQKPAERKARKAISGFKVRKGDIVGLIVTLRGNKMYDFLEKLIKITLPRIRDFRGLDIKSFDQRGNYNLGIPEQIAFGEVQSYLASEKKQTIHGIQITITTNAKNINQAKVLLESLGFPFKKK